MSGDPTASREALNTTLHDIQDRIAQVKERGDQWQETQKAVDELKGAFRQHQAAQAAANRPEPINGPERELRKYVESDEDRIHASGGVMHADRSYSRGQHTPFVRGEGSGNGALRLTYTEHTDKTHDFGLLDDEPVCEWQAKLQDLADMRSFIRSLQARPRTPQLDREITTHMRVAPAPIRKIFADASGVGAGWIPDVTLPVLERQLTVARRVEALFATLPVPNSGTMSLPYLTNGLRPYKAGAATSDDPAQFTSSSIAETPRTFTVAKLAVRAQVDRDAAEDSLLSAAPLLRQEVISALVDGSEDCIINGDTGTHQDTALSSWNIRSRWGASGLGGSGDHRRCWIGLRALAADRSATNDGSSVKTAAGFLAALASLDAPHMMGNVVCITSPEYLVEAMLGFDQVETLEKYGPQATILTGELGRLYGKPIVISEFMSNDLPTSGLYTTSGSTTGFLLVARDRFRMAVRRAARLEAATDITRDLTNYVATERKTFVPVDGSAKICHFEYNL